jgi:hypothetical protein
MKQACTVHRFHTSVEFSRFALIPVPDLTPALFTDKVLSRVGGQYFYPSKVAPRALSGESRPDFLRNEPEALRVARCQRFH